MIVFVCPHCKAPIPPFLLQQIFNCEACGRLVRPGEAHSVVREPERAGPRTRALVRSVVVLGLLAAAGAAVLWVNPDGVRDRTAETIEGWMWRIRGVEPPDANDSADVRSAPATGPAGGTPAETAPATATATATTAAAAKTAASAGAATARATPGAAATATGPPTEKARASVASSLGAALRDRGVYAYANALKTTLVVRSPRCATDLLSLLAEAADLLEPVRAAGFLRLECRTATGTAGALDLAAR